MPPLRVYIKVVKPLQLYHTKLCVPLLWGAEDNAENDVTKI